MRSPLIWSGYFSSTDSCGREEMARLATMRRQGVQYLGLATCCSSRAVEATRMWTGSRCTLPSVLLRNKTLPVDWVGNPGSLAWMNELGRLRWRRRAPAAG